MSDSAAPRLAFGDVCTGSFFFDAYLRADAGALRERTAKGPFVAKQLPGIEGDEITSYIPVNAAVATLKPQQGHDFLLAHGVEFERAVCLSDDCEIETRLGRAGANPSGTIAFAPIGNLIESERETLTTTNWGRVMLTEDGLVAELRRSFRVAAEDVGAALAEGTLTRSRSDAAVIERLEVWWQAHASRRGPLVQAANASKLARLFKAHDLDEPRALPAAVVDLLTSAVALEAHLEGSGQVVDDAEEVNAPLRSADACAQIDRIRTDIEAIEEALARAKRELDRL